MFTAIRHAFRGTLDSPHPSSLEDQLFARLTERKVNVYEVTKLINAGVNVNATNEVEKSPLLVLCQRKNVNSGLDLVRLLLDRRADVMARDAEGRTPLHYIASVFGVSEGIRIQLIKLLVEHQADVNARDNKGVTPLVLTARARSVSNMHATMQALLDLNADINAQDEVGTTTLQAVFRWYSEGSSCNVQPALEDMVCFLVGRGANINLADREGRTPLHMAAFLGLRAAVALLIDRRAEINVCDHAGNTPLHLGLRRPWHTADDVLWFVRLLLYNSNVDLNKRNNVRSTPLLCEVVSRDYGDVTTDLVQLLIDGGADVFVTDHQGRTLLHCLAESSGRVDVARLLVNSLINVNVKDNEGYTPLHLAVPISRAAPSCFRAAEILDFFLDQNANVNARNNAGDTALHILFADFHWNREEKASNIVELLASRGADAFAVNKKGDRPLLLAMRKEIWKSVRILLDNLKDTLIDVSVKDHRGNTPLHLALVRTNRDLDMVKFFLDRQAHVNALNDLGDTPLHFVSDIVSTSFDETVLEKARLLIDRGAYPFAANKQGVTPLHKAMTNNNWELVRFLAVHDVNFRDRWGDSPLHLAMTTEPTVSLETVQFLIDHQADVNASNDLGDTPLHKICLRKNFNYVKDASELVKLLASRGADPFATNQEGDRPILVLMRMGALILAKTLLDDLKDAEFDINMKDQDGNTLLHLALMQPCGNLEMVKFLLDRQADVNASNNFGDTPLHYISGFGFRQVEEDLEKARSLVDLGANPIAANITGDTPLHRATRSHKWELVRILTARDVNVRDYWGNTPMHLVTQTMAPTGTLEMVQFLLDHEGDVNAKNILGDTPLDNIFYRQRHDRNDVDIIQLLVNRAATPCFLNTEGDTPLRSAMRANNWKLVRSLLKDHIDDCEDDFRDKLLSIAVRNGDAECVSLLLERGANMNAPDYQDRLPFLMACEKGSTDLIYRLIRLSPHHFRPQLLCALEKTSLLCE